MNDNTYLKVGDTIIMKHTYPPHREEVEAITILNSGTRERISWNSVNYKEVSLTLASGVEVGGDEITRW